MQEMTLLFQCPKRDFYHLIAALLLSSLTLSGPALAQDCDKGRVEESGPSNKKLVALGLAMGAVDYILGVTLHEGSHAVAIKALGGEVTDFSILPSRTKGGTFRWGHSEGNSGRPCEVIVMYSNGDVQKGVVPCAFSNKEKALIYAAPKITNALFLGSFTLAFEKGWLDSNKYLKLGATVLATGALIDWSKDIFSTNGERDLPKFYDVIGADTELERLPYRMFHTAASAFFAAEVGRSYYSLFKNHREPAPKRKANLLRIPKTEKNLVIKPTFIGVAGTF